MNNSKINQDFLGAYLELDRALADKLGVRSGVTEYINKLTSTRFATERDDTLQKLKKYRAQRNRIAHEPGAIKELDTLTKEDVRFLRDFLRKVKSGKDPLSSYLKGAMWSVDKKALLRTLALGGAALLVLIFFAILIIFS